MPKCRKDCSFCFLPNARSVSLPAYKPSMFHLILWGLLLNPAWAFTNSKSAHVSEAAEEHKNPDMVRYTASAETPDFHFRRIGTTSTATDYAQVTVKFNLVKLRKHINAIATTVQEAAALTPKEDGLQIHMF